MFGRVAKLPVDFSTNDAEEKLKEYEEYEEPNEEEALAMREEMNKQIRINVAKAQKKQKYHYDKKHNTELCFDVGSFVLKKDFRRKKRKGGKLDYRWVGPYKIVKSLGKGLFALKKISSGKVIDN